MLELNFTGANVGSPEELPSSTCERTHHKRSNKLFTSLGSDFAFWRVMQKHFALGQYSDASDALNEIHRPAHWGLSAANEALMTGSLRD